MMRLQCSRYCGFSRQDSVVQSRLAHRDNLAVVLVQARIIDESLGAGRPDKAAVPSDSETTQRIMAIW